MKVKIVAISAAATFALAGAPANADENGPSSSYTTSSGYTVEKNAGSSEPSQTTNEGAPQSSTEVQDESTVASQAEPSSEPAPLRDKLRQPSALTAGRSAEGRRLNDIRNVVATRGSGGGNALAQAPNRSSASNSEDYDGLVGGINLDVADDILSDNVIILDALNQNNQSAHCIDASCNHIDDHSTRISDSFNGNIGSFNTGTTVFDIDRPRRVALITDRLVDVEGKSLPKTGAADGSLMLAAVAMLSIVLGMSMEYAAWRRKEEMIPLFERLAWELAGWAPYRSLELLPFEPMGYALSTWPVEVREQLLKLSALQVALSRFIVTAASALARFGRRWSETWSVSLERAMQRPGAFQL